MKRRLLRRLEGVHGTKWNNTHTYAISARTSYTRGHQCVCSKRRARTRIIFGLREDIWFFFIIIYFILSSVRTYVCDTFRISWCPEPIAWRHTHITQRPPSAQFKCVVSASPVTRRPPPTLFCVLTPIRDGIVYTYNIVYRCNPPRRRCMSVGIRA